MRRASTWTLASSLHPVQSDTWSAWSKSKSAPVCSPEWKSPESGPATLSRGSGLLCKVAHYLSRSSCEPFGHGLRVDESRALDLGLIRDSAKEVRCRNSFDSYRDFNGRIFGGQ